MSTRLLSNVSLALVLIPFLYYMAHLRPADLFGHYYDDTVYFSSARGLAEGRGYIQPSVPGTPPQTKYPVLYPWLLSWVWKWRPSFPDNIIGAVWMTALFSCWYVIAAFRLLRGLRGIGEWPAVALAGLCAFHTIFLALSRSVLSEVPFMALALTAAVAADTSLRRNGRLIRVVATAVLAGLSVMTRALGITLVLGLVAAALYRRAWRQAAVLCLAVAPFLAAGLLWPPENPLPQPVAAAGPGFRQTWLYYTSYWEFWKLSVPDGEVLRAMLALNLRALLQTPAMFCLFPPPGGQGSYLGVTLCITLTVVIAAGLVRQARSQEWKPVHFILPFYCALLLPWNYTLMDRTLLLFLPLFYAGLWVEGKHLASILLRSLRPARPNGERAAGALLVLASTGVVGLAIEHYVAGFRPNLRAQVEERVSLAAEKEELYDWIRKHTALHTSFIACEDAALYLHTGRQAMWPIAISTGPFFTGDQSAWHRDLEHIGDVARGIGASYWVMADNDFHSEAARPLLYKKLAELKSALPLVFRSRENRVQLYDLSCLHHPEKAGCGAAAAVLPR